MERWLETDDDVEAVEALEMAVQQLATVEEDVYRWKWVVLSLHNSLQGFMVLAIRGSHKLGAMTRTYAKHWLERYEAGELPEMEPRLAPPTELFQRIQSAQYMKQFVHSKPFTPTDDEEAAFQLLCRWRNEFMHYKAGGLSLEVSGFPEMVRLVLGIIAFLLDESGNVVLSEDQIRRVKAAIATAHKLV